MTSIQSSSARARAASEFPYERLLAAAAEIFARDGLTAATTREIANAANVNEVTLFRLFHTKLNLLAAVLERVFAAPEPSSLSAPEPLPETCVTEIVQEYAANYSIRLRRNGTLLRVLIGEIQHFREYEMMVLCGIFGSERQRLIDRLRAAQKARVMRQELDPVIIADQVGAIVLTDALRSSMPLPPEYSSACYLRTCVEMIVRGIEEAPGAARAVSDSQLTPPNS